MLDALDSKVLSAHQLPHAVHHVVPDHQLHGTVMLVNEVLCMDGAPLLSALALKSA